VMIIVRATLSDMVHDLPATLGDRAGFLALPF
jgi:hypothetical protein